MTFFWLPCIVSTYGVQPHPPCHHPPLHNISVEEYNREVDYQEHDWHFAPALTFELCGQTVLCGTNGEMNVILYQVHSQVIQRGNMMVYC
jgi:hypothetical protein